MNQKRIPVTTTELNLEERHAVLRALGYYQIHLFDEISKKSSAEEKAELQGESANTTSAIKKIHRTIEDKKTEA